jgi:hypothetical protein
MLTLRNTVNEFAEHKEDLIGEQHLVNLYIDKLGDDMLAQKFRENLARIQGRKTIVKLKEYIGVYEESLGTMVHKNSSIRMHFPESETRKKVSFNQSRGQREYYEASEEDSGPEIEQPKPRRKASARKKGMDINDTITEKVNTKILRKREIIHHSSDDEEEARPVRKKVKFRKTKHSFRTAAAAANNLKRFCASQDDLVKYLVLRKHEILKI